MKDAVQQMALIDIYKLSLSSKRSEDILKWMKLKTADIDVHLYLNCSCVRFLRNGEFNDFPQQGFYSKKEKIPKPLPGEPYEIHNLVSDHIEECLTMANRFSTLFKFKSCVYRIAHLAKNPEEMKLIISKILSEPYTELKFTGHHKFESGAFCFEAIDLEVLVYLMNNVKFDSKLSISAYFPKNFHHENAFKFQEVDYYDASWVAMETLKSFRDVGSVSLMRTNFNSKDLNGFIIHWVNSDVDMMQDIEINIIQFSMFNEDEVLDQLIIVVIPGTDEGGPIYLIKARNTENRKRILGKLTFTDSIKGIKLETLEANEQYKMQLGILELKEKEKDLENEVEGYQMQNGSGSSKDALQNMMERKKEAEVELAEVRMKLLTLYN
ncbi:unnamed protein product [Caenorhabditis brenneri]